MASGHTVTAASSSSSSSSRASMSARKTAKCDKLLFLLYVLGMVALIFALSDIPMASGMPRCAPCPGGVCPEPSPGSCPYGTVNNFCGRKVCARGPGEICGTGMFKMLGQCGNGLYCQCGRCIGCFADTFECYDKTCTK